MVKKFTLMFLLGIFGLFSTNLFAQDDATIDPSQIKFWIGEGQNEMVFIVNWNEPDTALAWGYRFSEDEITLKDVMDGIVAVDPRFGYVGTSYVSDITFNNGTLNLNLFGMYWMSIKNGEMCMNYFDAEPVHDGDYVKWGDESCGTLLDPVNYVYVWTKEVAPVYALGEEATIDPSEIVYWIGEGENEVIFAVNFAEPEDVCYAWGYKFAGESVSIKEMMTAIAEVDHRFAYNDEPSPWGGMSLTDLTFNYNEVHYELVGYNAMYNLNGVAPWFTFDEQTVENGDFVKWGDYTIATEIAQWTYVWTTPVQPVPVYNAVEEVEASMLTVYPNPATEVLYVNADNVKIVEIYDMTGRMVQTAFESVVYLRNIEAGVYFVTVKTDNAARTTKLVVK